MSRKQEMSDRIPHFPFQYQRLKEPTIQKMEQEHTKQKQTFLKQVEKSKKLARTKNKQ